MYKSSTFISVHKSVKARHGKRGYKLGKKKKLFLEKTIMHPFVPTPKSVFFLKQKRKYEYPLLTTKKDYPAKYVGSIANSNVLEYDPFLKIPTKKLAAQYLKKVKYPITNNIPPTATSEKTELPQLPNISPIMKKSKSNRNNQLKIISPIKKIRFKKPKSKSSYNNIRNPFQRHQLSDESRWLLSRLT